MNKDNYLKIGKFEIFVISDGLFQLDGGTMFGVIPKVTWSKLISVDVRNNALWGMNCLWVKSGKKNILIDTGMGTKLDEKQQKIYGRPCEDIFRRNLKDLGLSVNGVDLVIPTHFHMDHSGGFTDFDSTGYKPRFPNAKYLMQRKEWSAALNPGPLSRRSYLQENFKPVVEAGCEEWLDGDAEIIPGIKVYLTGAHTHGHQAIQIQSEGETLFCGGDLIPTRWHLRQTFLTCYELSPIDVMEAKTRWLDQAVNEDWMLHWYHDPNIPFGRVSKNDGVFVAKAFKTGDRG